MAPRFPCKFLSPVAPAVDTAPKERRGAGQHLRGLAGGTIGKLRVCPDARLIEPARDVRPEPGDASQIVTRRAVGGPGCLPGHAPSPICTLGPGPGLAAAAMPEPRACVRLFLLELAMKIDELS
jgi:hypothetical protein